MHGRRQHKNTNADGWSKKSTAKEWWTTHRDAGCLADVPEGRNLTSCGRRTETEPSKEDFPEGTDSHILMQTRLWTRAWPARTVTNRRPAVAAVCRAKANPRRVPTEISTVTRITSCSRTGNAANTPAQNRWDLACQHSPRLSLLSSNPGWMLHHLGHGRDLSYHRHR